jgi:hypothetical protein
MATVLGTLTIDIKSNTASFTQSMDKMSSLAGKSANDVKRSLEKITAAGIAMAAAVAGGTAALVKNALDTADRLDELAQSAGTTTEKLSALSYAAKFSGLSTEDLSGSLVKLSKSAFAAQNGNKELENVFRRLGVSVSDGNGHLKDSGDLLLEIAPKFAGMSDGAGKTALALQILGKSGAASIPVLNQLGESGAKSAAEAGKLGLVISSDMAKAAGDVNDNFDRLRATFTGIGLSIVGAALPALKDLTERLLNLRDNANFPDIGKAIGEKVAVGIRATGEGFQFAAKHASELKIAVEALLALQVAKFTIPFLVEISSGSLVAGVGKFAAGLLGIGRLLPVLTQFGTWLATTASELVFFAGAEGLAATSSYAMGAAFAAIGGPIGVAVAAITGLTALMYLFRDSTFTVGTATFELRDTWNAAWILMRNALTPIGKEFESLVNFLKGAWKGFVDLVASNVFVQAISKGFDTVYGAVSGLLGKITVPKAVQDALGQAKREREAADKAAKERDAAGAHHDDAVKKTLLPPPDTSGLGKKEKDPIDEEIKKLNLAISAQKEFLAVVGATPEVVNRSTSAQRAEGIILELNNKLTDDAEKKKLRQQSDSIRQKVALEDATKALVEYGKTIVEQTDSADLAAKQQANLTAVIFSGQEATKVATVDNIILGLQFGKTADEIEKMAGRMAALRFALLKKSDVDAFGALAKTIDDQQRSTALAVQQSNNLSTAESRGLAAVREAAVANTILGLTYDKNADQVKALQPELDKLSDSLRKKAAADRLDSANKDVFDLGHELASRAGLPAAILAGEDAYRKATLAARLYNIEQEITAETDDKVRAALERKRDLLIQSTKAENDEADARDALSLRSVADKFDEETAALHRQVDALTEGGKRSLTYGEALQVAAREQANFNKAIDDQVSLLTRFGGARDGVAAFFLQMQKDAKTTASIVFDALNSAFEKVSDNLGKLLTGQKTEFGKALQEIGQQIVGDTVKQQLQRGLAAIGSHLGFDTSSLVKPDGSKGKPFYVIGTTAAAASPAGGLGASLGDSIGEKVAKALSGKFGDPSNGGFIFHGFGGSKGIGPESGTNTFGKPDGTRGNPFYVIALNSGPTQTTQAKPPGLLSQILGPLLGAGIGAALGGIGGGGSRESVSSSISFPGIEDVTSTFRPELATPKSAYLVGQSNTNLLAAPSASMEKSLTARGVSGGAVGNTYNVSVDARGADPVLVEERTRRGILAAHNSAVGTAVQASVEFQKRTPQRI